MESLLELNRLPEDCVSTILSFTSPIDVCRSSLVSSSFQLVADSDSVWENLLPSDYKDIVSSSIVPLKFSSKKDLFLCLCNPIFIDDGRKSFKLEKSSGKKSYMLSARDLSITWSDEPMYWNWVSSPESRTICWLEIQGKITTKMLSPNTTYIAYLVLKISDRAYGLDLIPSEVSVEVGNQKSRNTVYLRRSQDSKKQQLERLFFANRVQMLRSRVTEEDSRVPSERQDGWMEIELGEFFNGQNEEEVVIMSFKEVKGQHLKGGLTVEGIEVRPKQKIIGINTF
ncbi:hypothetical protein JCGZ_23269 [Jatropha curcas]|uniref:F-box domain-containing protein n=1 Tax=Jatropha curcas TaxID=180498 RepID=A0A067JHL4_JATCU|nr:hypothetical protein JCGZ_23269 [Jatropha curcas]